MPDSPFNNRIAEILERSDKSEDIHRELARVFRESGLGFNEQATSNLVAATLENARLLAEHRREIERQSRMLEIATAINSTVDLSIILRLVRDTAVEECGFDRAGVILFDASTRTARGSWGTDREGNAEYTGDVVWTLKEDSPTLIAVNDPNNPGYVLRKTPEQVNFNQPNPDMVGVSEQGLIHLKADGEVVGFISVDNLLTRRPITEEQLQVLLMFGAQAASAISKAQSFHKLERVASQQKRFIELTAAMNETTNLRGVLRLVRDAAIDEGGFDRAGVFLYDQSTKMMQGTWGTDRNGNAEDISGDSHPLTDEDRLRLGLAPGAGRLEYVRIESYQDVYEPGEKDPMVGVTAHGRLYLRADEEIVGFISVDNLVTNRPITDEDLLRFLPFAQQAALAINKARLLDQRNQIVRRQRRLMELIATMNGTLDLSEVLRQVRDAVVEEGGFDRAGVFLYDEENAVMRGSWGTDRDGRAEDISQYCFYIGDKDRVHWRLDNISEAPEYDMVSDYSAEFPDEKGAMEGVHGHAILFLRANNKTVGTITVDNLLSQKPVLEKSVQDLLPFAHQAAAAVHKAALLKATEEELERRVLAEQELLRQAEELRKARDEAIEATNIKSQFLANMSHEIRTPMNGVIGMNALLLNSELTPRQREIARIVQNSAEALLSVINDVLDFSKIEAHRMLVEHIEFDLRECIEEVAEMMASRIGDKPVEFNCYVPPDFPEKVIGDSGKIRQVLMNLVGNAIKFTENGEVSIELSVTTHSEKGLRVRIDVRDTGIGIATDLQESIYKSFTQADGSMTRKYGGTGLGLTLTTQLVELLEGSTGMQSEEGRGSDFWFELNLGLGSSSTPGLRLGPTGKRVLVIDRSSISRRMLMDQLTFWGCSVVATSSLSEAALVSGVDLAFVDASVTVEEVRRLPGCADATIVPMVAKDGIWGDSPVLYKPFGRGNLHALLLSLWDPSYSQAADSELRRDDAPVDLGLKVLIAEDNGVNLMILESTLADLNCSFTSAHDGREALSQAQSDIFDLILMDLQMPIMDGIEAAKRIRAAEAGSGRHVPIIALTAHALQGDRERCLAAGMDDYLSKPIVRAEMIKKLQHWGCRA